MGFDLRKSVRLEALSIGMRARCNDLSRDDVDAMVTRAEEAMSSDEPLFRAITAFAVQYEECRFDRDRLVAIGQTLTDAIRTLVQHEPVDAGRADIYG